MIRVFLVDDQQLVRAGFTMLINAQADMRVVGEAGNGQEAVDQLDGLAADVVLMDIRMPQMDGVQATGIISSRGELPRVLVLTTFDMDEYALSALRAGASAFLLKDVQPDLLLQAIRDVHQGNSVVAPSTTKRLLEQYVLTEEPRNREHASSRLADLTERELDVLKLVAQGLSNTEIASQLVVAETTVKTHMGHLLAKTGSRDRVQLVVLAFESGLVKA